MNQCTTFYSNQLARYTPGYFLRTDGNSGFHTPVIPGAVAVAFWLHSTNNHQYGSFLVDFRENGSGYWWNTCEQAQVTTAFIDGVPAACYPPVFGPGWHKVYLEFPTLDQAFYLLCRYSSNEFFYPSDIADITFYNRSFTAVEKADVAGPLPTTGILAHYVRLSASRTSVVDSTGQHPDLLVVGNAVTDMLPKVWVRGDSLPLGPITQWRNQGYTGATQSLVPDAQTALPYAYLDSQNGQRYARFLGNDWLTNSGLLGIGATPFSLVLVFRTHRMAARNLLGWGPQEQGRMFDVYQGNAQVVAHYYGTAGPFNEVSNPVRPEHWQVLCVTNGQLQLAYFDSLAKSDATVGIQPGDSPLRVGAGQWPNLNSLETVDIAECRIYDNATFVEQERTTLLAELALTYSGGVAAHDLPVDDPAWHFSSHWNALTASGRPDIRMPFPSCMQGYAPGGTDNYAEVTFQVAGGPTEGVRICGMVEGHAQLDVYLNGVHRQTLSGVGGYTDVTNTLYEAFALAAGTHTLRLVKSLSTASYDQGVMLGGALVFAQD